MSEDATNTDEQPKKKNDAKVKSLKKEARVARSQRDEILAQPPASRDKKALVAARAQLKQLKREMRKLAKAN